MRLNLSSQIVLNKVPVEYYKPKTTVEYSEISRMENLGDERPVVTSGYVKNIGKIYGGIRNACYHHV